MYQIGIDVSRILPHSGPNGFVPHPIEGFFELYEIMIKKQQKKKQQQKNNNNKKTRKLQNKNAVRFVIHFSRLLDFRDYVIRY